MNIFSKIKDEIDNILHNLKLCGQLPQDITFENVTAEPPRDLSHGDISTNAAMVLSKKALMTPILLANILVKEIDKLDMVEHVSIAGPGFINIKLNQFMWAEVIASIIKAGESYGNSNLGNMEKVNIEYVSANPTGPMHIGHARGAVYGDSLALLLTKTGYDVTKEYYINDAGSQIDTLAKSAFLRYKEALGHHIGQIPEGFYPGEYLIDVGQQLANEFGESLLNEDESIWLPVIKNRSVDLMMRVIKNDLSALGVQHDIFISEKAIQESGKIEASFDTLDKQGLLYRGVLEAPKGKKPEDWEPREQVLFKSTDFGDDIDRPLKKSDGSYTYFASDIAYHLDKFERGYNKMVLILGADHGGYIKRLKAAVSAISQRCATVDIKISQLVNFVEDGKPIKMSKRSGTFTTVREVIEEVGKDVIRFIMLTRKNDAVLDFDLKSVKEQSRDNPIFYVQYACARANSVIRNAQSEVSGIMNLVDLISNKALLRLNSEEELKLIKNMASWPRVVEAASVANEPHRIAFYLQELASDFHSLWNKGKDDAILRFIIKDDLELTAARIVLLKSMLNVFSSGLSVFNIKPVREM